MIMSDMKLFDSGIRFVKQHHYLSVTMEFQKRIDAKMSLNFCEGKNTSAFTEITFTQLLI